MTLKEMYSKMHALENELSELKKAIKNAQHEENVKQMCEANGFPIGCMVEYQGEKRMVVGCEFETWNTSRLDCVLVAKINKDGNASKVTKGVRTYEIKRVND